MHTQSRHYALCALNTNDIFTSSTTGLGSGYNIKPSFIPTTPPPTHTHTHTHTLSLCLCLSLSLSLSLSLFRVTNQMQITARAYVVIESNSIGIKNVSWLIFIAVRPEVLLEFLHAGLRRAVTFHSASTNRSYCCTFLKRLTGYKMWPTSASKIFILFKLFFVTGLRLKKVFCRWMVVYSAQRTVYSVQCTVYIVKCKLYSVQCAVYSVQRTAYIVQCTAYIVQCTAYGVQCTAYTVHCTA